MRESIDKQLIDLKIDVKDRKRFENLSKDLDIKKWLKKIMQKWLNWEIEAFGDIAKYSKQTVGYYTSEVTKDHPELISFIAWELNLPIKTDKSRIDFHFSALSFEQKLNAIALYNTRKSFWPNFKKIETKKIISKHKSYMKQFSDKVTNDLNSRINKKKILWFVDLDNVLKSEYWLTDKECKKVKEYISLIQKHPEYVWWRMKPQKAGFWTWFAVGAIVTAIIWVLGYFAYDNIFSLKSPETRVYWDHTEIENFEEVFKIMSAQAYTTSNQREFREDWFGHLDESNGWAIIKLGKRVWNKIIDVWNLVQSRKLEIEVKTEVGYFFDFKWTRCFVEKKNWKWIFRIKTKRPEVKIINTDAKINKSKRELINMDKFDDFELRAVDTLKKEAIEEAKKPENLKKAEESLRKNLLGMWKMSWFASSQMVVHKEDVYDVIIEYEN